MNDLFSFMTRQLIKNNIIFLIFPISLILLWDTCFVNKNANQITCAIGLVLTFVSSFLLQKERRFNNLRWQKLFVVLIMVGATSVFIRKDGLLIYLYSPLFIGVLFLIFNFFVFKDLRKFHNNIFFVLITLIFVNDYFLPWHSFRNKTDTKEISLIIDESEDQNEAIQLIKKQNKPSEAIDLSSFSFMNLNKDTVNINSTKPYTFIETWNETCFPCKRAINELTPLLDSLSGRVDSYFIYINNRFETEKFITSTKKVKDLKNQNVIADYNQEFYNSLFMYSYPVFIIINNEEERIVYYEVGYNKPIKERLIEKLKNVSIRN